MTRCANCDLPKDVCVCEAWALMRARLAKGFGISEDEVEKARDEGRLYPTRYGQSRMVDDGVLMETIEVKAETVESVGELWDWFLNLPKKQFDQEKTQAKVEPVLEKTDQEAVAETRDGILRKFRYRITE